jgi:hypothetical protein
MPTDPGIGRQSRVHRRDFWPHTRATEADVKLLREIMGPDFVVKSAGKFATPKPLSRCWTPARRALARLTQACCGSRSERRAA